MIRIESLHEVFGPDPDGALRLLAEGRSEDEISEATGDVIGVHDVSFALKPGELFVIMGLSGSGKPTSLRCINRLIAPTSGRVLLRTDSPWINVPEIVPNEAQEGFEEFMVIHGLEGGVTDPVLVGFVAEGIQAVANNAFLEANPAAASILANVQIAVTDVSEMTLRISRGEDSDAAVAAMAVEWVESNRTQVDAWLAGARAPAN